MPLNLTKLGGKKSSERLAQERTRSVVKDMAGSPGGLTPEVALKGGPGSGPPAAGPGSLGHGQTRGSMMRLAGTANDEIRVSRPSFRGCTIRFLGHYW